MDKEIFVYVDLDGNVQLVGRLWSCVRNGRESATFGISSTEIEQMASAFQIL